MTRLQFLTCLFAAGLVTTGAHGQPRPDAVPLERQDTEVDPEQLLDADLFVNPAGIAGAQARATQRQIGRAHV